MASKSLKTLANLEFFDISIVHGPTDHLTKIMAREEQILRKFFELRGIEVPLGDFDKLVNDLLVERRHIEAKLLESNHEVLRWKSAAFALAEHVEPEVKLTHDNETIRRIVRSEIRLDQSIGDRLREKYGGQTDTSE